jgi:hypothetical protein
MENTNIPNGSSLRRPTGNFALRLDNFHCTSPFVVQIINVQRRSSDESTKEATSEREEEKKTAPIFAARRRIFARILIWLLLA